MTTYKYQNHKQHASNYNYKTKSKRSFGQRVKNFFTIPEEDLKEEPSKEFEKIKLFTLTRGNLFLGILVFMILINILVGFNINFLYLRQILGFLFIILIPGLLIMLCFKIRTVKFWEYLVYTVGLSIAFIMFAGLAVNWTLPALGITDKPLSLWPILICFDIFLIGLWLTAIYRNKDLKPFDITIPKLDTLNRIFFIIPMIFPILSILGAFLLNNHGPNILTMIMLGGIAVYVLLLVIFRKHMNENVWPWALWMIAISLLFMTSIRGWNISAESDVGIEYFMLKKTLNNSIWDINNPPNHAFNACLSLTILPNILNLITDIPIKLIIKCVLPLFLSLISLSGYLLLRKLKLYNLAFLSSFFYIIQMPFISWLPRIMRQEVAFAFFGLTILVLFSKDIQNSYKKILFVIFGSSIIVSHYSTAYITLALFTLTYLCISIYKLYELIKIKKKRLSKYEKSEFYLTGILVIILLIIGFLWFSQVTPSGRGLINFAGNSIENMGELLNQDLKSNSAASALSLSFQKKLVITNQDLERYTNYTLEKYNSLIQNKTYEDSTYYNLALARESYLPNTSYKKLNFSLKIYNIIINLTKLFLILGFINLLLLFVSKRFNREYIFVSGVSLFFLGLILIVPYFSTSYEVERLYGQIFFILSPIVTLGGLNLIIKVFKKKSLSKIMLAIIFTLYLLFNSGFVYQFVGGSPFYNLNNFGSSYYQKYSSDLEVDSIIWLGSVIGNNVVYTDSFSAKQLTAFGDIRSIRRDIIPQIISKDAYIFASRLNNEEEITIKSYSGKRFAFKFPKEFFDKNKNVIYSNGGSKVFK